MCDFVILETWLVMNRSRDYCIFPKTLNGSYRMFAIVLQMFCLQFSTVVYGLHCLQCCVQITWFNKKFVCSLIGFDTPES